MANPLQLTYNGVDFHSLGIVSIVSQSSQFSPDNLPQRETRTLVVRIDTWNPNTGYNYDTLYAAMKSARDALLVQNKVLKWTSPGETAGAVQLERPAMVVSCDLPEDPNRWGVYHQQINITFRFDLEVEDPGLQVTLTGTGTTPAVVNLGRITSWRSDFRNQFYSEWKRFVQRASGGATVSGELTAFLGETGATTDNRVALLLAKKVELETQVQAAGQVQMTLGPADARFFDRTVKVENFGIEIADVVTGTLKWTLTFSYTHFPDEAGFAAADFSATIENDRENSTTTLNVEGKVVAGTEQLALAKLTSVIDLVLAANGFASTSETRSRVTKSIINAPDTSGSNEFMELQFSYSYEKKTSNVLSYKLEISDQDDLKSGLITRTYSGNVQASAGSEEAAYTAALTKARELGDRKHAFRVNSLETRSDKQKSGSTTKEFVSLDFSYSYQLKGSRMYLELTTNVTEPTFSESQERVQGFVVAGNEATARAAYSSAVRQLYASALVRDEAFDVRKEVVQTGTPWYGTVAARDTMFIRLDFSLSVYRVKAAGTSNIKYGMRVEHDYVGLTTTTTCDGVFAGEQSAYAAIAAGTTNALDTFLDGLVATHGAMKNKQLSRDHERVGATDTIVGVGFSVSFEKPLSSTAQILACDLSEDSTYSATRWVLHEIPDGVDRVQNCGTTPGQRTVSGSVTAVTEEAALNWIKAQYAATGLWKTYGEGAAGTRYEQAVQVRGRWEFAPLTDGKARGTGVNFKVVTKDFTFTEIIPNYPCPL